jgi:hypothetical protein
MIRQPARAGTTTHIARAAIILGGMVALSFLGGQTSAREPEAPARPRPAPELIGGRWLNAPGGGPITLASRRGQVTVVHFWTFG